MNQDAHQLKANASGPEGRAPRAFQLRAVGAAEGFTLVAGQVASLGRDPLNNLQIGHQSVAPFHCRLEVRGEELWVLPLQGNSISLDGEVHREPFVLQPGLRIRVGEVGLEVALGEPVEVGEARRLSPFAQHLIAELRRAPWLAISVLFHVGVYWILQQFIWLERHEEQSVALRSDPTEWITPPPMEPPQEQPEIDLVDPLDNLPDPEFETPEPPRDPVTSPIDRRAAHPAFEDRDFLLGRSGDAGGGGLQGGRRLKLEAGGSGVSSALVPFLRDVRTRGMDLVFLVDTTSSMRPFLETAKQTIDLHVTQLAALVEDLRIGLVAFRDVSDDYVTRSLDLSQDRYEILNFLESLQARGGGDIPEAVAEGFEVVAREMSWRDGSHRVVLVVGDAPPHEQDWSRLRTLLRRFTMRRGKSASSMVSALFTGSSEDSMPGRAAEASSAFAEIARLGKGNFLVLGDTAALDRRLLVMAIGQEYEKELFTLLKRMKVGPRERLVRKKLREKDTRWLLGKLDKVPVHPDVVSSLILLADRELLRKLRNILADETQRIEARRAVLYILRKVMDRPLRLDPGRDMSRQRAELDRLDLLIGRF